MRTTALYGYRNKQLSYHNTIDSRSNSRLVDVHDIKGTVCLLNFSCSSLTCHNSLIYGREIGENMAALFWVCIIKWTMQPPSTIPHF